MSDIKMKFIKRVKQNIKKGTKNMYSRRYDFMKNNQNIMIDDETANKFIKQKIKEQVKKTKRKLTDDTEIQLLYVLDDDEVVVSYMSKPTKILFPSKRNDNFGSIDLTEKLTNIKGVVIHYFIPQN